ncbi:MAG: TPM domain-containing protein [bacterium]|nr:TPM domain-containing protein [bacterium]
MISRIIKFSLLLFIFFAFPVKAYYNPGTPTGFVNDYAGILSAEQKQTLESKLSQFEKNSSNEISVVTVPSLKDDTVENFAVELFKDWGIGKKDKDNGVLVLVALSDKKMRIEVGYGLEGTLTDAQASWIISDIMRPAFQKSDYYSGINGAVDKIVASINGENIILQDAKQKVKIQEIEKKLRESQPIVDSVYSIKHPIGILGVLQFIIGILLLTLLLITVYSGFYIPYILVRLILGVLGKNKSWVAGGIFGGMIGTSIGILKESLYNGLLWSFILIPISLLLDFYLSKYNTFWKKDLKSLLKTKGGKKGGFWSGGSSGGGGFGGFGGGSSGGGGASGGW